MEIYREKCPNMEFFLVRIFLYSEISLFSPNTGIYEPEKIPYLDTFHAVFLWRFINGFIFCLKDF